MRLLTMSLKLTIKVVAFFLGHPFWVRRLNPSAILVRQCHFQNLVLFRPHRTLEHNKLLTSRPPVALTEHKL